jgi:ribosome-binding protein aMBF1 (putative translation factor)
MMINPCRDCQVCAGSGRLYDDVEVGKMIREAREHAEVGLRQLARAIGWSPAYLSKLEHGKQQWNIQRINLCLKEIGGLHENQNKKSE